MKENRTQIFAEKILPQRSTEAVTEITEITKAHTEKADFIMIFTDEKKNENFFRIFTTEDTERRDKKLI